MKTLYEIAETAREQRHRLETRVKEESEKKEREEHLSRCKKLVEQYAATVVKGIEDQCRAYASCGFTSYKLEVSLTHGIQNQGDRFFEGIPLTDKEAVIFLLGEVANRVRSASWVAECTVTGPVVHTKHHDEVVADYEPGWSLGGPISSPYDEVFVIITVNWGERSDKISQHSSSCSSCA